MWWARFAKRAIFSLVTDMWPTPPRAICLPSARRGRMDLCCRRITIRDRGHRRFSYPAPNGARFARVKPWKIWSGPKSLIELPKLVFQHLQLAIEQPYVARILAGFPFA